jgi:hypothetical protein
MSQNHETRILGLQPPLPLVDPIGVAGHASESAADAEWRLDERTREVGRRGIAAARARLRSPAGAARRDGADRAPGPGPSRQVPGRAA